MDKATKIHLFFSGTLATISNLALYLQWSGFVSGVVVGLVNIYLIAMLYEAIHRSGMERKVKDGVLLAKQAYFFSFPVKVWTGLLVIFIVSSSISGFANMYIYSEEVVYVGPVFEVTSLDADVKMITSEPSILKNRIEALYFSLVTMITLGYGDFIPIANTARLLVVWQLVTGGLLVIGIFPLIISRVADF